MAHDEKAAPRAVSIEVRDGESAESVRERTKALLADKGLTEDEVASLVEKVVNVATATRVPPGPYQQAMHEAIRMTEVFIGTARLAFSDSLSAPELEREQAFHAMLHTMCLKALDLVEDINRSMPCMQRKEHDLKVPKEHLN